MLNVLIAGVGGQGNILASRVIAECAVEKCFAVKTSETIGMAQREGTVVSHVRFGKEVYSPMIAEGQGDILIGMEIAESARSLNKLKSQAKLIINDYAIIPAAVSLGKCNYDIDAIKDFILKHYPDTIFIPASTIAIASGSIRTTNVVMLGAIAKLGMLPFTPEELLNKILELIPEKHLKLNQQAFQAGVDYIES